MSPMETELRLKVLELIGVSADVRERAGALDVRDREYIVLVMEKAQAAAHRVLAFLDHIEGHHERM